MPKIKDKKRILKAVTEKKQLVMCKGAPIGCQLISAKKF